MKTIVRFPLVFLLLLITAHVKCFSQENNNLNAYSNFDFVPGETILFEDDFADATNGEFPPRWKLLEKQGVVNVGNNEKYFQFTECFLGAMGKIEPRIKSSSYLGESFTVEFDFFLPAEEAIALNFKLPSEEFCYISMEATDNIIKTNYFPGGIELNGKSSEITSFSGTWLHAAFAYNKKQIKCYINQSRVLVIPNCEFSPISLFMSGSLNVRMKNFKLASGGGMNMLDKLFTDGKFITHAIKFDVGKATIKGESMGFLNELSKWLIKNSTVKLEIAGHTDSDGDDASNLTLSQKRAEAVKNILIKNSIGADRLSTAGYGETKPIATNDTPEGKSENRRVEFIIKK